MVHGGACLGRTSEDELVLVDGAIPGEVVEAEITGRRGGAWRARTVAVPEPSADRVVPPCPYVPECGGCDLQHIAYPRQLALKGEVLADALRRQGLDVPEPIAVRGMADPWRYRWRGEFHVVPGAEGMRDAGLGFNRARSWSAIAVDDCLIHHRTITDSLPALRELVRRHATAGLSVLHLTAGEDGAELLVRPRPPRALDTGALDAAALALPEGRRWSSEATTLHWRGRPARVRGESFIQVNQEQMEVLYARALAGLGDVRGRRVVDAYAGVGVLSVAIAEAGAQVVCIESNHAAATLGVLNARLAGVEDRVAYRAQPVEAALPGVAAEAPLDAVVLDPPRAGCAGAVTGWLALAGAPRIVYISCDAATLARDLRLLAVLGPYRVRSVEAVDMFPQTHHVEAVAVLDRSG